jgi:hypothetical protein
MNGMMIVFLTILLITVPVALARWVFRVNRQIELLEKMTKQLETLVQFKQGPPRFPPE